MKCKECGHEMEVTQVRTLRTGAHTSVKLNNWGCLNCGTYLREGATREHDVWLPGLFRTARKGSTLV